MRRKDETWAQLLTRLDAAVVQAVIEDRIISELRM
jgi:hypothetical protein